MKNKETDENKKTTEEKILEAARKVFTQKGFSATRTRDIAQEAEINVALLNYYFRSKENLLKIVIEEKFTELFSLMVPVLADKSIALEKKVETWVDYYCELLLNNPDIPIFVLHEIRANNRILETAVQNIHFVAQPVIEKQLAEIGSNTSFPDFIMNIVGLTLIPFLARPLFSATGLLDDDQFLEFVSNRKKRIPQWIMSTTR